VSEDISNKGPGISIAQRIGNDARSALYANQPQEWNLGEIGGDDYGYDFQATAFGPNNTGAQCAFNIQLKGTTVATSLSSDRKFISYAFDRTTLNLWNNSLFAVLVIIVDLIESRDPRVAKVYYHLANYDLCDILPTLPPHQKTVTLRIPTNQLLHRDLDILPVVQDYITQLMEVRRLVIERRRAEGKPDSSDGSSISVEQGIVSTSDDLTFGDSIEAIIEGVSRSAELKSALNALRSGDYIRALEITSSFPLDGDDKPIQETAASAYLRSRALDEIGEAEASGEMLKLAAGILPDNDDIATLKAQKTLDDIDLGAEGRAARLELLASIEGRTGPGITNLKAKIYALEGDYETARNLLQPLPLEKSCLTLIIISIIQQDWERVLSEVTEYRRLTSLLDKQRFLLDVFESRGHFELAMSKVDHPEDGDYIIPPTGLPGIDYVSLRRSYESSMQAMRSGQRLNWPSAIRHVLDVFPISAMLLGYEEDALPLLLALGFARPSITAIREVVAKFAIQLDQPQVAVQLTDLGRGSPAFRHEEVVAAVASYKAGNVSKALSYVTDELLGDRSTDNVYLSSLVLLGIAADSALRNDLLEKIQFRLGWSEESQHYHAIMESSIQVHRSILQRPDAIRNLYGYWKEHGNPENVGFHILINVNPLEKEEAGIAIDVATKLEKESSLGVDHIAVLGQSHLTHNNVQDAIKCLRKGCERFIDDPKLRSLLGVALEIDGQSAEAFQIIGGLLESGDASETARRCFIEISARMGFFDQAEGQIRTAISRTDVKDTSRRLRHLNTLFQLLLASGDRLQELEDVAWQYGLLANREDEREEGIFLQEYLVATLPQNVVPQQERIQEFRLRLEAYSERFPKSKYLWRATLPSEGPPEALLAAMQAAIGVTDEDIAESKAIERKMDQGALHVPFSWRPRNYLRNVSDIFALWELRKRAPLSRGAYHFQVSIKDYNRQTPKDLSQSEIVLSLTSLMLLDEIGMLGLVLGAFERFVISRDVLISLQEARNSFTSGWGQKKADRILRELQSHFRKISHPPYAAEGQERVGPDWHHEEMVAMQAGGRVYFCDDIIEAVLVCNVEGSDIAKPSMSTVEFLVWADQYANILTAQQVATALGDIAKLKVGFVTIDRRYFVAAIPDSLQCASSRKEEEEAMAGADTLCAILDGIWDVSKPFDMLRTHFAGIMSCLINEGNASEAVLVALWLRWLQAIRFLVKPKKNVYWKLSAGFISVLSMTESNALVVRRLWASFWVAIKRGLGAELTEPEDKRGIRIVAEVLGSEFAQASDTTRVSALYEKARTGIEQGTELDDEFKSVYIASAAEKAKELLEKK